MKKIVTVILTIIWCFYLGSCVYANGDEIYIDMSTEIAKQEEIQYHAHEMAEHARILGIEENHDIIAYSQDMWKEAQIKINKYKILETYTELDLLALTNTIYCEAGHRENSMRIGVGAVVINRVNDPAFPNTIVGVVTQRGQYRQWYATEACKRDCKQQDNAYGRDYWGECQEIAMQCMMGLSGVPENVVWQANFKQGSGVYKYWPEWNFYLCYK